MVAATAVMGLIQGIFKPAADLIDALHTSPEEKIDAKTRMLAVQTEMCMKVLDYEAQILQMQSSIIVAEAQSQHWIAATWRPITMLVLVSLVTAHWMGWTATNLSEEQILSLFDLVKIGLGGYIVGRSGEKIAKAIKK